MQKEISLTAKEITETLRGVKRLCAFCENVNRIYITLGRCSGKVVYLMQFAKVYNATIRAYEQAGRKAFAYKCFRALKKRLSIRRKLHDLRLRACLWLKPKSDCCYCCLWCKWFDSCRSEVESEEQDYENT